MATLKDNLLARAATIGEILATGATDDGQKLSEPEIVVDGEVTATDGYVRRLYEELKQINELLGLPVASAGDADAGVPWEFRQRIR